MLFAMRRISFALALVLGIACSEEEGGETGEQLSRGEQCEMTYECMLDSCEAELVEMLACQDDDACVEDTAIAGPKFEAWDTCSEPCLADDDTANAAAFAAAISCTRGTDACVADRAECFALD